MCVRAGTLIPIVGFIILRLAVCFYSRNVGHVGTVLGTWIIKVDLYESRHYIQYEKMGLNESTSISSQKVKRWQDFKLKSVKRAQELG